MKVSKKSQFQYRIQHIMFAILLLGCIGFAGWLSNAYNQRSDWTAGKRHSLSNDTVELLKQLPFEIKLRSYQEDNPPLLKAITETLNRYKNNKPDFSFDLINPDIYIEQAKSDNIQQYGQTIIEYNGQSERINNLSEESISNALIRLKRNIKPQLLFVSQHGERSIRDNSAIGYSQLAGKLTNKGFEVAEINLLSQDLLIPNTLLILGTINKPLLDTEAIKIQQYIKQGGQLLWLQDPAMDASQKQIADGLNIHFIDGVVVDNNEKVSRMLQLSHPAIIPILEYKRHPITHKMQYYTLFTTAAAITSDKDGLTNANWSKSDLLITSDTSWSERKNFILGVKFDKEEDMAGPLSIGLALQRQPDPENSNISQRIVIIGDTDFIANNNLGYGANLDFILNTFNWLTLNDKLISIAPKNAPDLQLKLSASIAATTGIFFLVILPVLFFISGTFIWFKRHKK